MQNQEKAAIEVEAEVEKDDEYYRNMKIQRVQTCVI